MLNEVKNMLKIKGSKTEENLKTAFMGEAQAHTKYLYYAARADEEGFPQVGVIFKDTAINEREHAKIWFKLLREGTMPATIINLQDAAGCENFECMDMYASFAQTAKEEGFDKIAFLFNAIGKIESEHEERYRSLLSMIEEGQVSPYDDNVLWRCDYCGNGIVEKQAPEICPVCEHPKAFFENKTLD